MVILNRHADLLQVVLAGNAPGAFTRRLNSGQQKCRENADDCNYDQQLDEGKTVSVGRSAEPRRTLLLCRSARGTYFGQRAAAASKGTGPIMGAR